MEKNRKAVVYQIYPLSFKDTNHDGIGDINGITSELDYLRDLGIDVIWLSPVYQSPMDDNGYDISDYYQINPMFGSKADLMVLLTTAHQKGLKVIMDLVLNHTSDEHVWFKEALKGKDNPYYDYYIWSEKPSDITSVFSGSAWQFVPHLNAYYFHLFSVKQPDLNWQNPRLRQEIYQMINHWLDLGFDGFRLDVIDLIGKDVHQKQLADGPYLETYLEELYESCFKGKEVFTVGEMPGISLKRANEITATQKALDMVFQFDHIALDEVQGQGKWVLKKLDLIALKQTLNHTQQLFKHQGWASLFWSNHDQPRAVSRYGNPKEPYRKDSAKMLFTLLFGMKGTPYIYQGEEFGMTGIQLPIEDYRDIETKNIYQELKTKGWPEADIMNSIYAKGRDNSRTPMQWNDSAYGGFSTVTPWLKVNPNHIWINRDLDSKDPNGILSYLKTLLKLRKQYDVFTDGDFHLLEDQNPNLFIYERTTPKERVLVVCNWTSANIENPIKVDNLDILLTNANEHNTLKPYYATIFYEKRD
ncbi:MAG: alpha-glucosidase [Acholeplasma sp.]|jgi:glycosidase|nr:alpha-glucosidase [Acholeplasma sp.]